MIMLFYNKLIKFNKDPLSISNDLLDIAQIFKIFFDDYINYYIINNDIDKIYYRNNLVRLTSSLLKYYNEHSMLNFNIIFENLVDIYNYLDYN